MREKKECGGNAFDWVSGLTTVEGEGEEGTRFLRGFGWVAEFMEGVGSTAVLYAKRYKRQCVLVNTLPHVACVEL